MKVSTNDYICCGCCSCCGRVGSDCAYDIDFMCQYKLCICLRILTGLALVLGCCVGVYFYWSVNVSKMTHVWKYDYALAQGYTHFDSYIEYVDWNGTEMETIYTNISNSRTILLDPTSSKFELSNKQLKLFYRNKKIYLNNTHDYHLTDLDNKMKNNNEDIYFIQRTPFITTNHDTDPAMFTICLYIIKILVTLGFSLKMIVGMIILGASWLFTCKNWTVREFTKHHIYHPHICNSLCGETVKKLSIMTVSMILPLSIVTLFVLPFMAFDFGPCLIVHDAMPHFVSFSFVLTVFVISWSTVLCCGCCACCCRCCSGVDTSFCDSTCVGMILLCFFGCGFVFSGVCHVAEMLSIMTIIFV